MLSINTKNDCVTIVGFVWGIGLSLLPFFYQHANAGIGGLVIIYLAFKNINKPRGTPSVSFLSALFFFFGLLGILAGAAEVISNGNYIYSIVVILGILHLFLGYWAYQNLDHRVFRPGLAQSELNYEVISFDKVRELVEKVNNGNFSSLKNGDYKTEVSDAAIQALSEKTLRQAIQKIELLDKVENKEQDDLLRKYVSDLLNGLDENAKYQVYPLVATEESYLEYFYDGNSNLRNIVKETINSLDPNLTVAGLENSYFENNPCSKYWPVISKYLGND